MKELLMLAAAAISKEKHIESIREAVFKHELSPTEENYHNLLMHCHMFLAHDACKGDMKQAMKMVQEMDRIEKRETLFQPNKN